jgi:hypothetical protein
MRWSAVACLLLLSSTGFAEPKKYALLVGVNKYEHADLSKLDYAEADVAAPRFSAYGSRARNFG